MCITEPIPRRKESPYPIAVAHESKIQSALLELNGDYGAISGSDRTIYLTLPTDVVGSQGTLDSLESKDFRSEEQ